MASISSEEETSLFKVVSDGTLRRILSFIGLFERAKSSVIVNKAFSCACKGLLQYHGDRAADGRLLESQARSFSGIVDTLRYCTYDLDMVEVSPKARRIMSNPGSPADLYTLRQVGLVEDLLRMNVAVYSYWDTSVADGNRGIIDWFETVVRDYPANNYLCEDFERDVRFFKQDRVTDNFTLLFDTPSGTILVPEDCKRVYLVLGICDSIGYTAGFQKPFSQFGPLIGYQVATTLLPWDGMIVYDGLLSSPHERVQKPVLKRALRAFVKAVDSNTLITTLPRKPLQLRASSSAAILSTTSTSTAVADFTSLKSRLQSKISPMASMPKYGDDPWVFRRHGYTVQDNPRFNVTVYSTAGDKFFPFAKYRDLEPTVDEVIDLLLTCCRNAGGKRPQIIFVDAANVIAALKELLKDVGISVTYYPPPSKEEVQMIASRNAGMSMHSAIRGVTDRERVCAKCGTLSKPDGSELMKCSKCRKAYYCCREHQKEHWKFHKNECFA